MNANGKHGKQLFQAKWQFLARVNARVCVEYNWAKKAKQRILNNNNKS